MSKKLTEKKLRAIEKAVSDKYWKEWRCIPGVYGHGVDSHYARNSNSPFELVGFSICIYVLRGKLNEVEKKIPSKFRGSKVHFIEV